VEFTRSHPEYVRVPFAKYFPYLPCCRQVITRSQLKTSRAKYVRLLRASIRAHEFTIEHPREAAEIIGKWLNMPPSVVRESIMSAYVTLTPDPMRKGVDLFQRTNDKYDTKKTSTAEFIDTSLYRDALLSLAKERDDATSKGYYDTMIARFRANN
jgi:ABC-type nitrate/sulfonate/bicarbonate transport system substrate-binding protein